MEEIDNGLGSAIGGLSDENYAQSLDFCRFWFDIAQTYHQVPSDQVFDAIWKNRGTGGINSEACSLIHSTAHLILRFAGDVAELDHNLAPHGPGLQSRLCARLFQEFFSKNMEIVRYGGWADLPMREFYAGATFIAHLVNLGYVEEATIRQHILQSLISHPRLYDHQADALAILFKLAGAAFGAYADSSVVNRCFELLKAHTYNPPNKYPNQNRSVQLSYQSEYRRVRGELVQEVLALREIGWEGLPPPPIFSAGRPGPIGVNQSDTAATPVATSLGLPNRVPEPQIPSPLPLESVTTPVPETIPEYPTTPVIQSPSISIATLSDFTTADTTDDEFPTDPTAANSSDEELPVDPTAVARHETFYLEDGNVEVLCGNALFRVHTTILSFHSPALRRMFAQTNLATAESPNGCPRIPSSDTAKDFSTLLKTIYFPGFPERNQVPDFTTFSSLLRITAKYEMPTIRSQLLEVVRDAYPETFEGLGPSKPLGESVFSGRAPHPNEVLNLFVQQNLTSALPMAYYMAIRRGPDSLMDENLPRNATLSPRILQSAIKGLMALREVELNETHRMVYALEGSRPCSTPSCPSRTPTGPAALATYRKVFDHVVGSSHLGTKVLQVPKFYEEREGDTQCAGPGICGSCVERWERGHAELRRKAWAVLPDVFGMNG